MTEPPPAMEQEFNAWYDSEHLPERLAIAGFRSARRWVTECAPGDGKYLATYELDSPAVLESPAYIARYSGATPWTRRCLGRCGLFKRWACEQLGSADPHPLARAVLIVASEAEIRPPEIAGALQTRHFIASTGKPARLPALAAGVLVRLYRAYTA
jgi:hypothetical protein